MKKIKTNPDTFSGRKFGKRYNLDPFSSKDFYIVKEGSVSFLYYPDRLPDNPVLETNEPTGKKKIKIDPAVFSGKKFRERYGLTLDPKDYYIRRESDGVYLYFPAHLPDTPLLEVNDPLPVKPQPEIDRIRDGIDQPDDVKKVVRYLIMTGKI